jgi:hypothetical protein
MSRILDDFVGGLVQKFFCLRNEENSGPQDFAPAEQSAESVTPTLKGRLVEAAREQLRASEAARTSGTRGSSADGASLWVGSGDPAQPPMVFGALFEQPPKQSEGEGLFLAESATAGWTSTHGSL